jgi:hypothetical protein
MEAVAAIDHQMLQRVWKELDYRIDICQSPRVDISSTSKVGQKLGVSLPLLTCSPSAWPSQLLYCRGQNSQRNLWITLYFYEQLEQRKIANSALHDSVRTLSRRSLLSVCPTVLRYTCKCNFKYSHKKSTAFPAPIFHKIHKLQCSRLLYRISPIWDNKRENCICDFINTTNYGFHCTNFRKTLNYCTASCGNITQVLYPDWPVQAMCYFLPWIKVWNSLYRVVWRA